MSRVTGMCPSSSVGRAGFINEAVARYADLGYCLKVAWPRTVSERLSKGEVHLNKEPAGAYGLVLNL